MSSGARACAVVTGSLKYSNGVAVLNHNVPLAGESGVSVENDALPHLCAYLHRDANTQRPNGNCSIYQNLDFDEKPLNSPDNTAAFNAGRCNGRSYEMREKADQKLARPQKKRAR
jgi:hypothetical protein